MRLRLARSLFAALVTIALTAALAEAQDTDAGAVPVRGAPTEAVHVVDEPAQPAQVSALPATNAKKMTFNLPLIVFSAGAAADWTSTAWSLSHPNSREDNPLIAWTNAPAAIIAAGAAIDAVGAYAWMKSTTNHPTIRALGFLAAAAFRGYLVIHNIRNNGERGANRR